MINWQYYPKSDKLPAHLDKVIKVFEKNEQFIKSSDHKLSSNDVLKCLRKDLVNIGYKVEKGKLAEDKIKIPVLFGKNGKLEKSFEADGFDAQHKTILEVEAGRAVTNYQFLKDLFQACMMYNTDYLITAIRNIYRSSADFDKVYAFYDTLYASKRLNLPLKGILIIGY